MGKTITTQQELEYLHILRSLTELPFSVGKKLLVDFVTGDYSNRSITNNRLDELETFGSLNWNKEKVYRQIDELVSHGLIEWNTSDYNKFIKVLGITLRGRNELARPTLPEKKLGNNIEYSDTEITENDRKQFNELGTFLEAYNENQKKAIISTSKHILCVAGAGSGKTTVLTKRIEHLTKHQKTNPQGILAITFTRKARREMEKRLSKLNVRGVRVETFNSFCEKILKEYEEKIYGRRMNVQSYGDKILAMNIALGQMGLDINNVLDTYFTPTTKKFKSHNQLYNSFMNDCFSVLEYFKITGQKEYDWSTDVEPKDQDNARRIYNINKHLKNHMKIQGLRDYSDQIIDALTFLKEHKETIPRFEHILIDEYQDVNAMQIELLKLLQPKNLFAVGDPRQSIFGWRGSDINYILNFEKEHENTEIIHLTKNYRSNKQIVEFMNESLKEMKLPDLESHEENNEESITIKEFENENQEREYIIKNILETNTPREEIFVLARTNRQLQELSQILKLTNIPHVIKTDEQKNPTIEKKGEITLATIHAIKGLEAHTVFIMGTNEQNFPIKTSDHPAIEMIKTQTYNKTEEEKRLFYVAISRAKKQLHITHTKKHTYFITEKMKEICEE
jgi:superfamily I DNA/RNA helicase